MGVHISIHGDVLEVVAGFRGNTFDACLTDPPYGLKFMGKKWDYNIPGVYTWSEIYRVLKPGAFLLSFGGTRTYHRLACAIEDAGFEIRDCMMWLHGQGFPKSHDIGKSTKLDEWQGYSTALKPSWEPIIVAMKPIDVTFASSAIERGVAGLNIDECRVGGSDGRWPSNLLLSHTPFCTDNECYSLCPVKMLDNQSGHLHASGNKSDTDVGADSEYGASSYQVSYKGRANRDYGSVGGGASRFFYCAKVSSSERNLGNCNCKHPTLKPIKLTEYLSRLLLPPSRSTNDRQILIPFSGAGSEMIGALNAGWDIVYGVENDKQSVEWSERRINGRD